MSEAQELECAAESPEHGLIRSVWTDRDFAILGWHDAHVRGVNVTMGEFHDGGGATESPQARIALDLDYISRWVQPTRASRGHFTFWVAPCTLVFHGVTEWEMEAEAHDSGGFEIADVHLVEGGWHIEGYGFGLYVAGAGFRQIFRREPIHSLGQTLSLVERGGYSFDETPAEL